MLGIGIIVTAGSKVASVVRKGFVAWYKGNQIQSPTGEELVSNPDFSLESSPDLLDHNNWYRNSTNPSESQLADGDDFISHGNSNIPFSPSQSGITLTEHGFRFKTSGTSTFIAMAQSNIMNSAAANEETLMLTYDILQNSGSGTLYLSMSSNDQALDVTVGKNKVHYFTPTTNTFQIKRGGNDLDITIANIKLRKTNPGNKWSINKLASQDMTCTLTQSSNLITHPSNTNIKVGMKVQGSGIPSNTTITEVNVDGNNTQFRINNNASSNAPATSALRIRSASTVHVKDGEVFIDYVSSDANSTGVSISGIVNHNVGQKYRAEVDVKSISENNRLKVQIGGSPGVLNLAKGLNVFEYVATGQSALYLVRSDDNTSVQAVVTRVSLKKVEASVKDFSSQTNDAELYTGACLNFAGTAENDGIDLGILDNTTLGSATYNATDPQLTIATWFKADALGSKMIFSTGKSGDNRFYLWTQASKLELGFGNASGSTTRITGGNSVPTLQADRWYRVVVVLKGPVANLYLDGEYKYSKVSTVAFTTEDPLHIGIHADNSSPYYFDGQISDFQVYDTAWNQEDVAYDFADPNRDVFERVNATEYLGQDELAGKSDSDWVDLSGGGWSVSNGVLTYDGTPGGNYKSIYIPFDSVPGAEYEVSITMTNHTPQNNGTSAGVNYGIYNWAIGAWTLRPNLNSSGNETNYQQTRSINGVHSFRVITNNRRNAVRIQSNNGSATTLGEIFNVTIKRVHHVSVQPTDCLAIYRLNEYYGGRIFNSAPTLGEELVNDGGFASDLSNWGSPSNWVYANGGAKKTAAAGSGEKIEQTISSLVDGNLYSISFDLDIENTAGETSIGISSSGAFGHIDGSERFYQTSGTKRIIAKYVSSGYNNILKFVGAGNSVFTIDNISVKEIKLPNSQVVVSDGTFSLSSVAYNDNTNVVTHATNLKVTPGMTVIGDNIEHGTKVLSVNSNTEFTTNRNIQTPGNANLTGQTLTLTKFVSNQPHIPQFGLLNFSKKVFFDGVNDFASNANSSPLISRFKDYSISLWFIPYSLPNADRLGVFQNSQNALDRNGISIFPDGKIGGGHWGIVDQSQYDANPATGINWSKASSDSALELGKLYHVVFTNAAYTIGGSNGTKMYINGVLQSGTDRGYAAAATGIYIGKNTNGSELCNGFVDEVSIFSKELNIEEVQEIFNTGTALDVRDHSTYLGSELVSNNDFTDNTLNTSGTSTTTWTRYKAGTSTASISNGVATLSIDGSNSNVVIHQADVFESGKIYKISLVAKASADFSITFRESQGATANNTPSTAVIATVPLTTEYQTFEYTFTATGNQGDIFIGRNAGDAAGANQTVTIDSVSIKEIQTVGYWRNNGLDTWTDLSVYGNDCAVSGSPKPIYLQELPLFNKDIFGLPMNRVRRNGLNLEFGAAIADPAPSRTSTDAITVEAWVYPRQIGAIDQAVVGLRDSTSYLLYRQRNQNYYRLYINDGDPDENVGCQTSNLDFDKWYHIVAVYDKTRDKEFNIYVNGSSDNVKLNQDSEGFANPVDGVLNESILTNETELYIGKYSSGNFHGGLIDDVKIYDRRLSSSEIKRNYNATKGAHKNLSIVWSDDFSEDFG